MHSSHFIERIGRRHRILPRQIEIFETRAPPPGKAPGRSGSRVLMRSPPNRKPKRPGRYTDTYREIPSRAGLCNCITNCVSHCSTRLLCITLLRSTRLTLYGTDYRRPYPTPRLSRAFRVNVHAQRGGVAPALLNM